MMNVIQVFPLATFLEWIFNLAFSLTQNYGVSLIILSIIVNIIYLINKSLIK